MDFILLKVKNTTSWNRLFSEKISLAEVIIEEDDFEEDTIPNGEKSPTQLQSHDEQVDNPDVDTDNEEEIMEKTLLTPYDKFIAKVLKHSPRLKDMTLESHQISGKTGVFMS